MSKLPITAIIIALNEAQTIQRALASLDFVQEVLVIDGGSSDDTVAIAEQAGARVVQRAWPGFCEQRNFSLREAKHDWVLVVDADECVTAGLRDWLHEFCADHLNAPKSNGYKIRRIEYFLGREIKGACWNPSYQDRFFLRDKAAYIGHIHEYPVVEGGMVRAPDTAALDHNQAVTIESFLKKMNTYTTVEAHDRYLRGIRTNLLHAFVAFFASWWKNFFYYKAYRDGSYGFVISVLEGVSRTVRHLKLWQIQRAVAENKEHYVPTPAQLLSSENSGLHDD